MEASIWDYHLCLGDIECVSCSIRLKDSLIINICGRIQYLDSMFFSVQRIQYLHGNSHQRMLVSETLISEYLSNYHVGWAWPGVLLVQSNCRILWLILSVEGIKWYLRLFAWKYLSWRYAYETTTHGWVRPGVSLIQSDWRILWWSVSPEEINWYLSFLARR